MKRKPNLSSLLTLLGAVGVLFGAGCSNDHGVRNPNQAPVIKITGGPVEGSKASYTSRIYWSGYDNDGVITHYEYAIDPPEGVMTDKEILHPEDTTSVTLDVIPGPTELSDTLRVCKSVDGELYCFDWVQTTEFSRSFAFETPTPDSVYQGTLQPDQFYSGVHRVYVRAQDNEGMYSTGISAIGYTARTITPTAVIESPNIEAEILTVGPTLTIRLSGFDPDSPEANKAVDGYVYRLLRLDTLVPAIPITAVTSPKVLYTLGEKPITWTPVDADTESITLLLATPGSYVFGVRAVDVAGAVEPFLEFGRNAFKFQALATAGFPQLVVREAALGRFPAGTGVFKGQSTVVDVDVPAGQRLKFTWSASAEEYGGKIEAYSYGLDVPELDREGPNSGWKPWGETLLGNSEIIVFPSKGFHVLYVRARDAGGVITIGTIFMNVVEFSLDNDILYVDDTLDGTYPNDAQHTQFWQDRLNAYNDREVSLGGDPLNIGTFKVHGLNDRGNNQPKLPELQDLGSYKLLIWENFGNGFAGRSALLLGTALQPVLGPYLAAGGQMWLGGRLNTAATISLDGNKGDFVYPKDLSNRPANFMYQYMKLHTENLDRSLASPTNANDLKDSFLAAIPAAGSPYPRMGLDSGKLNPVAKIYGGVLNCEAVFGAIFAESEPGFRGEVDTLYWYGASGNLLNPDLVRNSRFNNRLCAVRWFDKSADRPHGRTQWFGFPLYYIKNDEAQETLNRSLDWFREERIGEEAP